MSEATVITPSSVSSEISVSDLGRFLGGETVTPAPTPEVPVLAPTSTPAPAEAPAKSDAPEAAAVKTPAAEPEEKTETEEKTVETKQEPQKKEKSWQDKRLSALSRKRREAEAIALAERQRAEELQGKLDALEANPGPKQPSADAKTEPAAAPSGKPELKTFIEALGEGEPYEMAVERYQDARDRWRDQQRAAEEQQKSHAEAKKAEQAAFRKQWDAAMELHPDFDDIVGRVREAIPVGLQVAITQVEDTDGKPQWPDVTMYLDEHPDELAAITAQHQRNPLAAAASLGRIAATLSKPTPTTPVPPVKATPKPLPKPPVVVGATATPGPVDLESKDTDMDVFAKEMARLGIS